MENASSLFLVLALAATFFSLSRAWKQASRGRVLPGPKQFPFVGRVHDLDPTCMWKQFQKWADMYGPIYRTSMMGDKFLIVSDIQIAEELLVKRGHIYSGRAQIRALFDHKAGPGYVALMDRHDIWVKQRKWVSSAMSEFQRQQWFGAIETEMKHYLSGLLLDPDNFHENSRGHCGRIMSRLAYDDATLGPEFGKRANCMLHQMSICGSMANKMPILWNIPHFMSPWKKYERARENELWGWWAQIYRVAKSRFLRNDLPSTTWTSRYFRSLQEQGNIELKETAKEERFSSCMLGFQNLVGIITIGGPLQFFLMAMMLHPEWQKRAQDEIDRVCGDRLPVLSDRESLPTVRACLKESLRWRPTVPLGVPHAAEKDDEYMGEKIEKGTIVMACEWNLNRNAAQYPDPDSYRPERYLEKDWPSYQEPLSRYPNFREGVGMHTFGWGRRTCLGQNLADDELFLTGASVLWGFDLKEKIDPTTGSAYQFDSEKTNSHVILEPEPFPCDIKPRGEKKAAQILSQFSEARSEPRV